MGRAYICAVSKRLEENYRIGLLAGKWGVEAKYWKKISVVKPGDLIVFVVAGAFRSIHPVVSNPYEEHTLVWPAKNGDIFPYRVDIGPAEISGFVQVAELAENISFMREKVRWSGTLQGANGVFNRRLDSADLLLIRAALAASRDPAENEFRTTPETESVVAVPPVQWMPDLFEQLARLSRLERDDRFPDPYLDADEWRSGLFAAVYADPARVPTIAVMPVDRQPRDTVGSTLYGMSSLKVSSRRLKEVRGLIFIREQEEDYSRLIRGVSNVRTVGFDVRVNLRA